MALTSDGLATPSAEVLEEMLSKHPQAAPPTLPSGQVPPPLTVSESAVKRGVRSFPNGSAPGPSGLRPSHLREAVGCPSPDRANRFLSSLTRFLNLLAAGRAPPTITPHLCGASLLASRKRNGGHRPIAVGEVLRRLVSKYLASLVRSPAISLLAPLQLGVSVQGDCEAIVHATSQLMTSLQDNQHWTLLLDFSNAFQQHQPRGYVRGVSSPPPWPLGMDGVLLLLPPSPPPGQRRHPQLLRCAAGGSSGSTGVLPNSPSHRRAYQGRGSLPRFECLHGTSTMEPRWVPRRVSLLHWTSLRGTAPLWASTSTNPSPFLLSPASVTPRIPPCHQISPSPEEASVSSAAPSDQNPTVKRSCRTGSRGLGSLWHAA